MKRFIALLMALVLFVTALPGAAVAKKDDPEDKHDQAIATAQRSYRRALRSAGKSSFHGYCGQLTSHQLWNLGINSWCASYNGKDQYDAYRDKTVTTGGHYIKAYSATEFDLLEVLELISQNGTRDVYNIMLCFQRTKTQAGRKYGHSCLINAILDGTVYMVESSNTSLGGPEGTVIQASMEEIAAYYDNYATFEGAIWFSVGEYADACDSVTTDLLLQARFDTTLRSQPAPVGQNQCQVLRTVKAGERLRATEMLTDSVGQRYYKVQDGYVATGAFSIQRAGAESVSAKYLKLAKTVAPGTDSALAGTVCSTGGKVSGLELTVTDSTGALVFREYVTYDSYRVELQELDELLELDLLEPGDYSLQLYADAVCAGDGGLMPQFYYARHKIATTAFRVGEGAPAAAAPDQESEVDGWAYRDGKWYFYQGGLPCVGWVSYCGVKYLLDDTGAAITGQMDIEGKTRYFSATGALCTGWLKTDSGMTYRDENGVALTGMQKVGGSLYCFSDKGILRTEGQVTVDGAVYTLPADGKATLQ